MSALPISESPRRLRIVSESEIAPQELGRNIRLARFAGGWSVVRFSAEVTRLLTTQKRPRPGISPQTLYSIEVGARTEIDRNTLWAIAGALGVTVDSLLKPKKQPASRRA